MALSASVSRILPGLVLSFTIAAAAMLLRSASGITALSPLLLALLLAVLLRQVPGVLSVPAPGLAFASRRVLRTGIILVGAQVTIAEMALLGPRVALIAGGTLVITYVAARLAGRALGISDPQTQLIAAGTAVCGASAIVAANSVARAREDEVGYAVAGITLFGTVLMLGLPLAGEMLNLSALHYGVWVGASVHEVAQVAAAGFQHGQAAGEVATLTKLMRVMLLAPLILVLAMLARRQLQTQAAGKVAAGAGAVTPVIQFPWFVVGFILLALVNSLITLPEAVTRGASFLASLCLTAGMAAMGLGLDLRKMRQSGLAPLLLGAAATIVAVAASYGLILALLPDS